MESMNTLSSGPIICCGKQNLLMARKELWLVTKGPGGNDEMCAVEATEKNSSIGIAIRMGIMKEQIHEYLPAVNFR